MLFCVTELLYHPNGSLALARRLYLSLAPGQAEVMAVLYVPSAGPLAGRRWRIGEM